LSSLRPADDRLADFVALRAVPAVGCAVFVLTTFPSLGLAPRSAGFQRLTVKKLHE